MWLPYASAAVANCAANSVTVFAHYFCGYHTFLPCIPTCGTRSLTLNIGHAEPLDRFLAIASIQNLILGADFLRHFALLVDVKHHHVHETTTQLHAQGMPTLTVSPCPVLQLNTPALTFDAILKGFPAVTQPCTHDCPLSS